MNDPSQAEKLEGQSIGTESADVGSPAAVDVRRLVIDHHGVVYGYAYRLCGQQADAEDVSQQTFLMAQKNLHQLRRPENPVPWLLAIVRSCWLKSRRRQRPVAAATLDLNVDEVAGPLPENDDIDCERLQLALGQLAEEFRLPLVMFFFEERSYKEIAADLEIPIGTVMSRLARAKTHLRKLLTPEEADDDGESNDEQNRKVRPSGSAVISV